MHQARDAESIRQFYQASIRGLAMNHYSTEQIVRWTNSEVEVFVQGIQKGPVLVCEFEDRIIAYSQVGSTASTPSHIIHKQRRV